MHHIGAGKEWDLARKIEGVHLYPPFIGSSSGTVSHGRIGAIYNVLPYIKASTSKYAVLMDCDHVSNIDVSEFVNDHINSGADISILCYKPDSDGENLCKGGTVIVPDENGRVVDIIYSSAGEKENACMSMNVMVMERGYLIEMIEDAYDHQHSILERDVLQPSLRNMFVRAHQFNGYTSRICSIQSYFTATMSLLDSANRKSLFLKNRPIFTKVNDDAPVRYGIDAVVKNSLIADGCVIEGNVENCVLFRGVTVSANATVKNSILMQNTVLEEGANVNYIISDKRVTISNGRSLMGYETYPLYIQKGSIV